MSAIAKALHVARGIRRPKVSKESVHYSKGMPKSHCGICQHFQPPHSCEVVAGKIERDMWCRRFKAKSVK